VSEHCAMLSLIGPEAENVLKELAGVSRGLALWKLVRYSMQCQKAGIVRKVLAKLSGCG